MTLNDSKQKFIKPISKKTNVSPKDETQVKRIQLKFKYNKDISKQKITEDDGEQSIESKNLNGISAGA